MCAGLVAVWQWHGAMCAVLRWVVRLRLGSCASGCCDWRLSERVLVMAWECCVLREAAMA